MGALIPLKTQISIAHAEHLISHPYSVDLTHFVNIDRKTDNNNSKPDFLLSKESRGWGGGLTCVLSQDDHLNQGENFPVKSICHRSYNVKLCLGHYKEPLYGTPTSKKEVDFLKNNFKQDFITYVDPEVDTLDCVESDFSRSTNHYHQDGNNITRHYDYSETMG